MFIKSILIALLLNSFAFAKFSEIDEIKLQEFIKKGVVVIDIRRDDEFERYGIIEGAKTLTFFDNRGNYDISAWMNKFTKYVKTKEQVFVLYCAHANRSKMIGNFLDKQLHYKNVYELKGGINYGWIDKGLKTVKFK